MIINGKEVRFCRTVWSNCKMTEAAPDHDLEKFYAKFQSPDVSERYFYAASFIVALNEGYEKKHALETGEPPEPLTIDAVLSLEEDDFLTLLNEATEAFKADGKRTVNAQPKAVKKTAKSSNPPK